MRGLSVALVEKGDLASGTSSRSTKLLHGGLRYLERGHLASFARRCASARSPRDSLRIWRYRCDSWSRRCRDRARAGWRRGSESVSTTCSPATRRSSGTLLSAAEVARALAGAGARSTGGVEFADRRTTTPGSRSQSQGTQRGAARRSSRDTRSSPGGSARAGSRGRFAGSSNRRDPRVEARAVVNATGPWVDRLRAMAGHDTPSLRPTRGRISSCRISAFRRRTVLGIGPGHGLFAIPGATLRFSGRPTWRRRRSGRRGGESRGRRPSPAGAQRLFPAPGSGRPTSGPRSPGFDR